MMLTDDKENVRSSPRKKTLVRFLEGEKREERPPEE